MATLEAGREMSVSDYLQTRAKVIADLEGGNMASPYVRGTPNPVVEATREMDIDAVRKAWSGILPTRARPVVPSAPIGEGKGYSASAAIGDEFSDGFDRYVPRESTDSHVQFPVSLLASLMMMIGDDKIKLREDDLAAAEKWRAGRRLTLRADHDPLCYTIELED